MAANLTRSTGLGRMVTSIADGLDKRNFDIGYVFEAGEPDQKHVKIKFRRALSTPLTLLKDLVKMRKFCSQYDVVVCFDAKPAGILAHLACIGQKKKIVVHVLGTYSLFEPKGFVKNLLIQYIFNHSSKIFLINEFVRGKIESSRKSFVFGQNCTYVPVGVDVSYFTKVTPREVAVRKPYIISVGAIKERKSQLISLQAFHKVHVKHSELNYVIVGSQTERPAYFKRIQKYVTENSLQASVVFLTDVTDDELVNLYRHALLFILTPVSTERYIEGFGMVYIESALAGITSVGTFDSGAEAAIKNNQTGLLANYSVEDVAEKITALVENDSLRKKLADSAFVNAKAFDWEVVVDLYVKELKKL